MQELPIELLERVSGGADTSLEDYLAAHGGRIPPAMTPLERVASEPHYPPGTQFLENDHSGPTIGQRVEDAFNRATRVMRTFNDTFGWSIRRPGMGNR